MVEKVNAPDAQYDGFAEAADRFLALLELWERFLDQPAVTADPPDAPCWRYRGHVRFWKRGQRWICGTCHPPLDAAYVQWHTVKDGSRWRMPT